VKPAEKEYTPVLDQDPTDWSPAEDAISAAAKKHIMAHRPIVIPETPTARTPFLLRFAERPPQPVAGNRTYAGCTGSKAEDYMDDDK
jgi:hypothetical protein